MLEETEWQDKGRNRVEFESEAFGCKVTSKFYQPKMGILGEKVGGNFDMTGDRHIGGKKVPC